MDLANEIFQSPITALLICLLLGAVATSGKFSQVAANVCLAGVFFVGANQIARSTHGQGRLFFGGILMLAGFCLVVSQWIRPPKLNSNTEGASANVPQPTAPKPLDQSTTDNHSIAKTPPSAPPAASAKHKSTPAQAIDTQETKENKKREIRDHLGKLLTNYKELLGNARRTMLAQQSLPIGDCLLVLGIRLRSVITLVDWSRRVTEYAAENMEQSDFRFSIARAEKKKVRGHRKPNHGIQVASYAAGS